VYYGAHSGDHTIYPDCRPDFILPMMQAVSASTDGRVGLRAPFMDIDKTGILRRGLALGLDYSNTWSCYAGGDQPCGLCGACQERSEAFALNNAVDPTIFAEPVRVTKAPEA
jgi:7-cyano-7-deazaguanine synthase